MKIFFNGDSHTSGSELYYPTQDAYSYKLAKMLGADQVVNVAIGGASNDRILRTTEQYLKECEVNNDYPDFIVIGWTESCRNDWYIDGSYYSTFSQELVPDETYKINEERAKYHWETWRQPENRNIMAKYYNDRIFDFHKHLEFLKIPHLFFLGVCSFDYEISKIRFPHSPDYDNYVFQYDWDGCFWKPYEVDGSFMDWGRANDYEITPYNHLKEQGHHDFAHILYDYINENSLLKS